MIDKQLISYLRLLHASYNSLVMLFFFVQGLLGLRIRRERKAGNPIPLKTVRLHRKAGPVLAALGVLGFVAGMTIAFLDYGGLLRHALHFSVGFVLACSLITTVLISQKIKGSQPTWRDPHFSLGLFILSLYPVQAFLGIGILL